MIFKIEFTNHHDYHFEATVDITAENWVTIHEKVKGTGESKQAGNIDEKIFADGNGHIHRDENNFAKHWDFAQEKSEIHPSKKDCPPSNVSRSFIIIDLNEDKVQASQDQN